MSPARLRPNRRHPHARTVRRVSRATGTLATAALDRMQAELAWYRNAPPDQRSWIGLILQAGLAGFVAWLDDEKRLAPPPVDIFTTAPREMARAITLQQTVSMVRMTVDVVEERVDELAAPGEADWFRSTVLRYSREIAFAAAEVYAQAAEARGAWDARLEALVVDAVLRGEADEALHSRAAALGWRRPGPVTVVMGSTSQDDPQVVADAIHRIARHGDFDVLVGVQGERLVTVLGGAEDPVAAARQVVAEFGPGPVVLGPAVADLASATRSASAAAWGLRSAGAWPDASRPIAADDLLPERAIAGDPAARRQLVEEIYRPLLAAGPTILETVAVYLEQAPSLEATARMLFVHPNTVRYRLRRVTEITGFSPTAARPAFLIRIALTLGRLGSEDPAL
jgi:DNA-binding PucR family transcriptional regulator